MHSDFFILAAIMITVGIAGIFGASVTHPIMYINPAIIFGFVGYYGLHIFREGEEGKRKATVFKNRYST